MNGTLLDDRFPYSDLLLLQVAHALRLGYGWVRAVAWFSLGGFVNDHRYQRSINAPATGNTFDAFLAKAKNATNGAVTSTSGALSNAPAAGMFVAAAAAFAGALLQL